MIGEDVTLKIWLSGMVLEKVVASETRRACVIRGPSCLRKKAGKVS